MVALVVMELLRVEFVVLRIVMTGIVTIFVLLELGLLRIRAVAMVGAVVLWFVIVLLVVDIEVMVWLVVRLGIGKTLLVVRAMGLPLILLIMVFRIFVIDEVVSMSASVVVIVVVNIVTFVMGRLNIFSTAMTAVVVVFGVVHSSEFTHLLVVLSAVVEVESEALLHLVFDQEVSLVVVLGLHL